VGQEVVVEKDRRRGKTVLFCSGVDEGLWERLSVRVPDGMAAWQK